MFEVPATAIARTELLKLLPSELVDRILVIVYHYDFRFTMTEINNRKYEKSIWVFRPRSVWQVQDTVRHFEDVLFHVPFDLLLDSKTLFREKRGNSDRDGLEWTWTNGYTDEVHRALVSVHIV